MRIHLFLFFSLFASTVQAGSLVLAGRAGSTALQRAAAMGAVGAAGALHSDRLSVHAARQRKIFDHMLISASVVPEVVGARGNVLQQRRYASSRDSAEPSLWTTVRHLSDESKRIIGNRVALRAGIPSALATTASVAAEGFGSGLTVGVGVASSALLASVAFNALLACDECRIVDVYRSYSFLAGRLETLLQHEEYRVALETDLDKIVDKAKKRFLTHPAPLMVVFHSLVELKNQLSELHHEAEATRQSYQHLVCQVHPIFERALAPFPFDESASAQQRLDAAILQLKNDPDWHKNVKRYNARLTREATERMEIETAKLREATEATAQEVRSAKNWATAAFIFSFFTRK